LVVALVAFAGLAIPGAAVMFGAGVLITSGAMVWLTMTRATAGAILGDGISYLPVTGIVGASVTCGLSAIMPISWHAAKLSSNGMEAKIFYLAALLAR